MKYIGYKMVKPNNEAVVYNFYMTPSYKVYEYGILFDESTISITVVDSFVNKNRTLLQYGVDEMRSMAFNEDDLIISDTWNNELETLLKEANSKVEKGDTKSIIRKLFKKHYKDW